MLRRALAAVLLAAPVAAAAQPLTITHLQHYTENRGWNDAGLGPVHQVILNATVTPSGFPTLVFARQDGAREPLTHFPQPGAPDLYAYWRRYEPGPAQAWTIVAEREGEKSVTATAAALANPRKVPLLDKVNVNGKGTQPRLSWKLPRLDGHSIDRIRVAVRGGTRVQGRFMSQLHVSPGLPATASRYTIPAGWLEAGERYVFQVMLEDLEGGALANRSLSFSDPYTPSLSIPTADTLAKLAQVGAVACQPAHPVFCGNIHVSCSGRSSLKTFPFQFRATRTQGSIENPADTDGVARQYANARVEWHDDDGYVILRPRHANGYLKLLADGSYSFRHYAQHDATMSRGHCR